MIKLTDETLMLYADGLLGQSERERIAGIAARDGEVEERIGIFRATGGDLADLFDDYLRTPARPLKLPDLPPSATTRAFHAQPAGRPWQHAAQAGRLGQMLPLMAASVALICGMAAGWLLRGHTDTATLVPAHIVEHRTGKLIVQGALRQALETMPSGRHPSSYPAAEGFSIGIRMTFQNVLGDYCREYELRAAAERHAGVACRAGGDWIVTFQALLPPAPPGTDTGRIVPTASSRTVVDAAMDELIVGGPLAAAHEAALLGKGWIP